VRNTLKVTAALMAMLVSGPASAGWEPTKPIEIVVAAGAGGASDQMARMMQAAIQKNNLMKAPIVVSLKGGASGAEALMYMKSSEGDPNKVLIAYSLIYMLPLSAKIPFNWRELTPVSVIAMDQFVLWDNVEGPNREGVHRGGQGVGRALQDGRHRLQARGSRADCLSRAEERREILLSAL
jgi:tripartite-type tricarboxylate transporter receptor subunit TctC